MEHHKACARCRQYLRICRVCLLGRPCSICRRHHAGCVLSLCMFFSHGSVSFLASGLHRFVQFGHQLQFPMQRLSDIFVCGLILCVSNAEARSLFELLLHVGSEVEISGEKSVKLGKGIKSQMWSLCAGLLRFTSLGGLQKPRNPNFAGEGVEVVDRFRHGELYTSWRSSLLGATSLGHRGPCVPLSRTVALTRQPPAPGEL